MKIKLYNGRIFDLPEYDAKALVKSGKAVFLNDEETIKPKTRKKVNND